MVRCGVFSKAIVNEMEPNLAESEGLKRASIQNTQVRCPRCNALNDMMIVSRAPILQICCSKCRAPLAGSFGGQEV